MGAYVDLIGQRFGRLVVTSRAEDYVSPKGHKRVQFNCICDCGAKTVVCGASLRSGKTVSCGCRGREITNRRMKNSYCVVGETVYVDLPNTSKKLICDKDVWLSGAINLYWRLGNHGYVRTATGRKRNPINFHIYAFPDCPDGKVRDHINGNRLDNRRENIRFVTMQENSFNRGMQKRNISGKTGVTWIKRIGMWRSSIRVNGKIIYLGNFKENELELAIKAREEAEKQYFGEYRRK